MSADENPLVRQLRKRLGIHSNIYVNDTITLPVETSFTVPRPSSATGFVATALKALFRDMTGREPDIHKANRMVYPGLAWDVPKEAWLTTDGYGFLTFLYNFGPHPSDGIDTVFKLACPNGCQLTTWVGEDYVQKTLTCRVNGATQETVDALAKQAEKRFIESFT